MRCIRSRRTVVIATAAALVVLVSTPSASLGRSVFGARLKQTPSVTPGVTGTSEASPWMGVATNYLVTGAAHGHRAAPHDGRIDKVKLIAGLPGDMVLYLAKTQGLSSPTDYTSRTRITRRVARIHYDGQTGSQPPFHIETVDVHNTKVKQGEYLAARSVGPGMDTLTCGIAPTVGRLLFYQPPLVPSAGFTPYHGEQSCQLLVKATMK